MPFCTNCGQPYTQPLKFCTACGKAIEPAADVSPVAQLAAQPSVSAQPAAAPYSPSPASVATAKKFNTGKRTFNYKIPLLLVLLAVATMGTYKFFFATNPKEDGAAAANRECNCNELRTAAWSPMYQAFITASASRAFISNEEIAACVDSLASAAEKAYDSCSGEAKNFYATAGKKYVDENYRLFNEAYLKAGNECRSKGADFNTLFKASQAEAWQKLRNNTGQISQQQAVESNEHKTPAQTEIESGEEQSSSALERTGNTPPVSENQSKLAEQLSRFFEAENSISSVGDIDNALDYYSYPMRRNFKLSNVTRERQHQIYKYQYVTKNLYHKLYDYQGHIKEIPLADGRTRLEVTFKFETSDNADGSNSRIQTVSNAYVFNADGKIESAGLATDKSL